MGGDFEKIKPLLTNESFTYLDPPYVPASATANFTGYTDQGFDLDMQLRLKCFCDYMDSIGAKFLMSNSSVPFIHDLYSSYMIETVMANRSVNYKGTGRCKVKEVLIRNYWPKLKTEITYRFWCIKLYWMKRQINIDAWNFSRNDWTYYLPKGRYSLLNTVLVHLFFIDALGVNR